MHRHAPGLQDGVQAGASRDAGDLGLDPAGAEGGGQLDDVPFGPGES
jgi:hypothetical protein